MLNKPLVSIITVVYNGEKFLQQTITSVANQTYKNIEYIIVDGGSKDNTVNIIKQNQAVVSKWVSERDNGISDAFNKGIRMCTGEIVGLVNADDWLEPDAVQLAVDNIEGADIIYGDVQFWYDEKPIHKTKSDHSRLRIGMTVAHPSCFVRRQVYETYGSFKLQYKVAMDYDLLLRFFQHGVRFKKVEAIFSNMRTEGNSDKLWLKGIKEEKIIKAEYFSKAGNQYHFVRQFLIFTIKSLLRRVGYHT